MLPVATDGVEWSVGLSVTIVSPTKTTEPIEMPFGLWTWVGPRNRVLDAGALRRHLANTTELSLCSSDAASCQITLTTCYYYCYSLQCFDTVWLGVRKSIRPAKKLTDEVLEWLSVWSKVQMICIWSTWCHCHPIISCFIKTQIVFPLRCRLTRVSLIVKNRSLKELLLCYYYGRIYMLVSNHTEWLEI